MRARRYWRVLAPLFLLTSVLAWTGVSSARPFGVGDDLQVRFVAPTADVVTEPLRYGTIQVEAHDPGYGDVNGAGIRGVRLRVTDDATGRVVATRLERWVTYDFGPRLDDGQYTLEATAYSRSGRRTTITRPLTVDTSGDPTTPPTTEPSPTTAPTTTAPTTTAPTTGPSTTGGPPATQPPSDDTTTYSLTFRPAAGVTSSGTGSVTAVLTESTRTFTVKGSYEGMTGPEQGLHIHTYPSQLDVGSTPGAVAGSGTIDRTHRRRPPPSHRRRRRTPNRRPPPQPRFPAGRIPTAARGLRSPARWHRRRTRPRPIRSGSGSRAPHDTCSKATHDTYWVYGPDGNVYPTWHPPTDPATGCTFGHEHGRDPAGSDLADIPFPFGYANEQAMLAGTVHRHEDHVGHKIEWYNDGGYYNNGNSNQNHDVICDVAYKMHQGSHSADAFSNNLHEVFHYARCENGSELIYRALHPFGNKGEFNMHCDQSAGDVVPFGERDGGAVDTGNSGTREIPAARCFEDRVLVADGQRSNWHPFDERWTLYQNDDSDDFGRFFIQFYFFVDLPSRYWDGTRLARTVDLCYRTGERQVRNDEFCEPMRRANPGRRVQWDDPASPFNGADRQVFMVDLRLDNKAGQTEWYTDVHGSNWSATPFPGSIEQRVGTTPIRAAASYRPSPIRSIEFDDDLGLHAPN